MNEDRQIKKIIKQLRKSVKSHDKQADTLEKKLKEGLEPLKKSLSNIGDKISKSAEKRDIEKMSDDELASKGPPDRMKYKRFTKIKEESDEINEEGLRAWFGKSRSKGGKPGWVQVVSGKPCARQPGQKSTPKCVSSAKRASMSDAERKSAQRRKRKADPNQRFKSGAAKPTYVRTDSKRKMKKEDMHSDWKNEISLNEMEEKKYKVKKLKPNYKHQRYAGSMKFVDFDKQVELPDKIEKAKEASAKEKYEKGKKMFRTGQKESVYSDWKNEELVLEVKDKKGKGSGKKDACYHKVKSRYSVWPSAYASGALVKCRKKGAKNWGNSSKKESYDPTESFQQFQEKCWKGYEKKGMKTMFGKRYPNCVKKTKSEEVEVDTSSNVSEEFYRKKYDVKKGGYVKTDKMTKSNKRSGDSKAEYRDLHKDLAKYEIKKLKTEEMGNIAHTKTKKDGKTIIKVNKNDELDAQAAMKNDPKYILGKTRVQPYKEGYSANPAQQAAIAIAKKKKKEDDMVARKMKKEDWRSELGYVEEAKKKMVKVKLGDPSKIKVKVTDIGAGGKEYVRKDEMNEAKSPAWQRKAGKSESGGLNAKGVASYRAANPGSKLKTAVTTKPSKLKKGSKAANRRKSFCARMKGMKKRLTSAKTARDPDSRINKSLRKWNC